MEPKCAQGIPSCGLFHASFCCCQRKSFLSAKVNFEKVLKIAANAACQYYTNFELGLVSERNFEVAAAAAAAVAKLNPFPAAGKVVKIRSAALSSLYDPSSQNFAL